MVSGAHTLVSPDMPRYTMLGSLTSKNLPSAATDSASRDFWSGKSRLVTRLTASKRTAWSALFLLTFLTAPVLVRTWWITSVSDLT